MFSKLISKFSRNSSDSPIYLGDILVNPRSDIKAAIEIGGNSGNTPEELRSWVSNFLELPFVEHSPGVPNDALILDVAIIKYQAGTDALLYSQEFILPFFWRPSVSLKVRLREHSTDVVLSEHSVKKITSWKQYLNQMFSLKAMFGFKASYTSEDLRHLLGLALLDAMVWVKEQR